MSCPLTRPGLRRVLASLLAACLAVVAGAQEPVDDATRMLRLRDGNVLFGTIEAHAPEELRFRRLDNGGLVELPWSLLDPGESERLRLAFGYVDSDREELLVDASRLRLVDGNELVGLVDDARSTATHLWLKRANGGLPVPRARLRAKTAVRVPALDVYTKDELYRRRAAELAGSLVLDGPEGARAHDELARYAERVFAFARAAEHYRIAMALDPAYDAERLAAARERAERKAALEEQVELLAEIDLWRARERYDRALEQLELFPKLYPDSPLMEDWNATRRSVERSQERDLFEAVVGRVHSTVVELARDVARQRKTYEEVLAYLDEAMERDLFASVAGELGQLAPGIGAEDVRRIWSARKGGRHRQASYGLGTWLLGEARALETYEEEEEDSTPAVRGSAREAREKLEERIERYLRNQELARRASASTREEDDPNAFWETWHTSGRYGWIIAYFVEFSGLFRIEGVRLSDCRECGGTGAREVLYTGNVRGSASTNVLVPCPTCHTIGAVRRIRYR